MEARYVVFSDENGNDQKYTLGICGITKILKYDYSPEPYCSKFYVQVFKEDKLLVELFRFSEIGY